MSIPDLDILRDYTLTLSCGHKRRTMAPCQVGKFLPCMDDSHYGKPFREVSVDEYQDFAIAEIYSELLRRNVDSIGWMNPQAAAHGAYDEAKSKKDKRMWAKVIGGFSGLRF